MNQEKIGKFIKELRQSKELTQEQLAEEFNVSNKTISRWENGRNMPDISVLIDLADFLEVRVDELLEGERSNADMEENERKTLLKVYDYSRKDIVIFIIITRWICLIGFLLLFGVQIIEILGLSNNIVWETIKRDILIFPMAFFCSLFIITTEDLNAKKPEVSKTKQIIKTIWFAFGFICWGILNYLRITGAF